jgi:hypothetical protein
MESLNGGGGFCFFVSRFLWLCVMREETRYIRYSVEHTASSFILHSTFVQLVVVHLKLAFRSCQIIDSASRSSTRPKSGTRPDHHSCTCPASLPLTLEFAQYLPVTPPRSSNANLIGMRAPCSGVLGGCTRALPTNRPISVAIQPGQQALITTPGLSRTSSAVRALTRPLDTL